MTAAEYDSFVAAPYVDERLGGADGVACLVIVDEVRPTVPPGSLPVVVVEVADDPDRATSGVADIALGRDEVDDVLGTVDRTPLAATTLVLLLRSIEALPLDTDAGIEHGLSLESAAYSVLQGGPEFAAWRERTPQVDVVDDGPTVRVERSRDRLTVSLSRPARHNAITARLRDELTDALWLAVADPSIQRVDVRGDGPSFCSGGDLDEFGSSPDPATAHRTRLTRSPARLLHRLRERTVIYTHGATLGGGIELAAFADRVIARPDAVYGLPELALGLLPGAGGTVSLTRRVGRRRTALLALRGHRIDAPTALDWGLIDEIA